MTKWGMTIDLKRCIGCQSCTMACKTHNGTPAGIFFRRVVEKEFGTYPNVRRTYTPVNCMHCDDAPCVANCPAGVFSKRDDGIVEYDAGKCYGARVCRMVCPYNAVSFIEKIEPYDGEAFIPPEKYWYEKYEAGTAVKCTFCADRLADGLKPACVKTCPTEAMAFGDLEDPESDVSRLIRKRGGQPLHPELGTKPNVYYLS
ncbi:MAG: 4Fe-4S dicluster domain-containing protein [Actinobacteria bacterium]|nr:4Fe-4S dicluster domain-containing protein [Actinomycetota bacterium]MCL5736539.1 4Fe-4S dicluster domain-containing protein [Actinomycetota bacterium]